MMKPSVWILLYIKLEGTGMTFRGPKTCMSIKITTCFFSMMLQCEWHKGKDEKRNRILMGKSLSNCPLRRQKK